MYSNFYEVCGFWWFSVYTLWFLWLCSLCPRNRFKGHKEHNLYIAYTLPQISTYILSISFTDFSIRQETQVWSPGQEDPLEKGMATTQSNILTWRIPWTEEPGRLQSKGSQRIGRDWATNAFTFLFSLLPQWNYKILPSIKHHSTKWTLINISKFIISIGIWRLSHLWNVLQHSHFE